MNKTQNDPKWNWLKKVTEEAYESNNCDQTIIINFIIGEWPNVSLYELIKNMKQAATGEII